MFVNKFNPGNIQDLVKQQTLEQIFHRMNLKGSIYLICLGKSMDYEDLGKTYFSPERGVGGGNREFYERL